MTRILVPVLGFPLTAAAATDGSPEVGGVPVEFFLFALLLLGVALFHRYALQVTLAGLALVLVYKLSFTEFDFVRHLAHEWHMLLNLLGLLLGFSLLAKHFEESKATEFLPRWLPAGWPGVLVLLGIVFVLSAFLDNIAGAMIGGTIALVLFKGQVHLGFLAAIVAASNAGGAGSVIGDTTTTMMWIDGVPAKDVLHGFIGALGALGVFGLIGAIQQNRYAPLRKTVQAEVQVDRGRLLIVAMVLVGTVATNVWLDFPAVGVWGAILLGAPFRQTAWDELPHAFKGSLFLLSLVLCASMMPVERLPEASWETALALGFVSAVFDNIPLTKLALDQGGYDWGVLAYAVGFGGSMTWFGSSAGVALSNTYPQIRSVSAWLRQGWHVVPAYVIGFFLMLALWGWHPQAPHKGEMSVPAGQVQH